MYNLLNLKNEFKRYIAESKSYGVDYISGKIGDMIYVCGLIMTLSFVYGYLNFNILLRLMMWYILYNTSLNAVSDGEFEIRADFFKNLTYTKTSIWTIYFNRFIVYTIEAVIVFIISLSVMLFFIDMTPIGNMELAKVIAYILITTSVNLIIYYFLISLTFIFERTMTFTSLLMTFILFVGGMVFDFNNIFSNMLFGGVAAYLEKPFTITPLIAVMIGSFSIYGFARYTENYIRKY